MSEGHQQLDERTIGVGVVGFGWMGRVHTLAYARVRHHFPDLPVVPRLIAVADAEPGRADAAAPRFGFVRSHTDWRAVLDDPEIGAVSVAAPNSLHAEIGAAVAQAGKHLWIEKPVGFGSADARTVADAVGAAGVQSSVGFNYRNAPAVQRARAMIAGGEIGTVTHARVRLFSDYAAHPMGALTWRFDRARGGNGVLGDLASHGVDLARYLLGEIETLVADTAVFVPQRPLTNSAASHFARADGGELGDVGNEDYLSCLARFTGGARVAIEASRVSVGDQNNYGIEVHGTRGSLAWDFRRMGELAVAVGGDYQDVHVSTVITGPGDGEYGAFQPGAGLALSYDDLKVIEAANFLRSIATGVPHGATIADAVRSAVALEAMEASVRSRGWVDVPDQVGCRHEGPGG